MIRRNLSLAIAATIGVLACLAIIKPIPVAAAEPMFTIDRADAAEHPQIVLEVSGDGLDGVSPDAFNVREGDRPVDLDVTPVLSEGLEVVLVVDTSGSMNGAPMAAARQAASRFLDRMPPGVRVAVVGFGAQPAVIAPFTTDRDVQQTAVRSLEARGETALYDALVVAAGQFTPDSAGRRSLVVLSDGGDTVSRHSVDQAKDALAGAAARLAIVQLVSSESDRAALDGIAAAAGGRVVASDEPEQLLLAYDAVAADLAGRYRLTFRTTRTGPTDVGVTVRTADGEQTVTRGVRYPGPTMVAPTTPTARTADAPGLLASPLALPIGVGALVTAMLTIALVALRSEAPRVQFGPVGGGGSRPDHSTMEDIRTRATGVADRVLDRRGQRHSLDALLEQAGVALRAGEFVVAVAAGTVVTAVAGLAVAGPLGGLLGAAVAVVGSRTILRRRVTKRRKAFSGQLNDLLQVLAGSLRAGYGLMQALESAGREMEAPAGEELRRLTTEVRLGRDQSDALDAMADRVGDEDFGWIVQAIRIHREVGGDLAEVLDRVAETVRARVHLKRQVAALSAEGRLSGYVLMALPIGVTALMTLTNRAYIAQLFASTLGYAVVATSVGLLVVGGLWLRRLVQIAY